MHYTSGLGTLVSFGGGQLIPGDGALSLLARILLDLAGGLFALYLLFAVGLSLLGARLRRKEQTPVPTAAQPVADATVALHLVASVEESR